MPNNRNLLPRRMDSPGVSVQDNPLTIHGLAFALEAPALQPVERAPFYRQVEQIRNPTAVSAMAVFQHNLTTLIGFKRSS